MTVHFVQTLNLFSLEIRSGSLECTKLELYEARGTAILNFLKIGLKNLLVMISHHLLSLAPKVASQLNDIYFVSELDSQFGSGSFRSSHWVKFHLWLPRGCHKRSREYNQSLH